MQPANTAISVNPTVAERFSGLTATQKWRMGLAIVLFVAIGVVGLVMGRQAEWRVLYANLADKDGGSIVAQLTQMNIPYKHADGGGAILVPADKVYDTRLRLASQGLPKGSVGGFESIDANRFGMTQFQERLAFQRGLEGELTRSIQALSSVQSARVHLALPNQNGFFREQQKPTASVVVGLIVGRALDRAQLAGIVHLVASSVPEMSASSVSVLDDSGKLLSTLSDSASAMGLLGGADAQQLQVTLQIEQQYMHRILDILEPVVGKGNVKAQVTAELDFTQSESTSEYHKPDSTTIRSQQTSESTNGQVPAPTGVPGATANQPPSASTAPINGAAQQVALPGGSNINSSKKDSTTNYEVDKTIKMIKGGTSLVKRVSAAVVVNHQTVTDAKGKTASLALTDQQVEEMTALVRETIGFSKERGDSVNLMNTPFVVENQILIEVPFWRQPEVQDIFKSFAWPVGTIVFALVVLLGAIRPSLKLMSQPPAKLASNLRQLEVVSEEDLVRPVVLAPKILPPVIVGPTPGELAIEDARKLTRDNPAAVANIVKSWVNKESLA